MDAVEIRKKMDLGALSYELGRFISENQADTELRVRYAAQLATELKAKIDVLKDPGRTLPKCLQHGVKGLRLVELDAERSRFRQAIQRLDSEEDQIKRALEN